MQGLDASARVTTLVDLQSNDSGWTHCLYTDTTQGRFFPHMLGLLRMDL